MDRLAVPAPETRAPMAWRKLCKSMISGSWAAPMMVVTPGQPQAASMMFSVAPTLGMDRQISRPRSPSRQAIHGAKNSVLPILAACLLTSGQSVIHNCPDLTDVSAFHTVGLPQEDGSPLAGQHPGVLLLVVGGDIGGGNQYGGLSVWKTPSTTRPPSSSGSGTAGKTWSKPFGIWPSPMRGRKFMRLSRQAARMGRTLFLAP